MSLQKGSRSQRHTRAGARWDNCTGITRKPLHTFHCYKKATGYMCCKHDSHTQTSGWKISTPPFSYKHQTAENPKLTELKWEWCLHPNPGTAVLTTWTRAKVLLLLFVHLRGAHCNKLSLKPSGYSLLKFRGSGLVCLTLKCYQQKPSPHWGNTATGKVIFRSPFCWSQY